MKKSEIFYICPRDEQESTIIIDYFDKEVHVYTFRKTVYQKLMKKLGEPKNKHFKTGKKELSGAEWSIPFSDRQKIRNILSITNLVGRFSKK